jgi:hypothetical protein
VCWPWKRPWRPRVGVEVSSFFYLGARWKWVVNAMSRPLYPRAKTQYSLYRKLGGPQGRSGRVRKIPPPTRIRSPNHPAHTESLYRLSYPGTYLFFIILLISGFVKSANSVSTAMRITTLTQNNFGFIICVHSIWRAQVFVTGGGIA